jgi:hypothetical protein
MIMNQEIPNGFPEEWLREVRLVLSNGQGKRWVSFADLGIDIPAGSVIITRVADEAGEIEVGYITGEQVELSKADREVECYYVGLGPDLLEWGYIIVDVLAPEYLRGSSDIG